MRLSGRTAARRAFTLTELAIVLGVIGLILGAIWTAVAKVYANNRVNKAVTEVLSVVGSVRAMYGGKGVVGTTPANLSQFAVNTGMYPADMLQPATCGASYEDAATNPCPTTPWNSEMLVCSYGGCGGSMVGAANRFEIALDGVGGYGVATKDCPAFMAAIIQQAAASGLVNAYSDGTGLFAVTTSTAITSPSVTGCVGNIVLQFTL